MKYLIIFLLMSGLAFCSQPAKQASDSKPLQLVDTNWKLSQFQAPGGTLQNALNEEATLWFTSEGSIGGNTGCNSMGGDYKLDNDQLTIQAFSTKMYCEPVAVMENAINEIMAGTMTAERKEAQLILQRAGGKLIYNLMDKSTAMNASSAGEAVPRQYDAASSEPTTEKTELAQASNSPESTTEMTGLFRYLADAANFQRCSDGKRFAVAMDGAFQSAETVYGRMEKHGAPSLMTLAVEVTKNPGEGHDEIIIIRKVVSSSYEDQCPE